MRVRKVFNNNVLLGVDERGTEVVLLGRGLGFQAGPGDLVDPARVERQFRPTATNPAERIAAFIEEIPLGDIEVTQEIVDAARARLGEHITDHLLVPLADHISFALRRVRENAPQIEYPLRWEVQYLYPAEVAFAKDALRLVEQRTGVALPEVEAVPLALHFVNAQFGTDLDATLRMTQVLGEMLAVIRSAFGVEIDEDSVGVARFVTHLRYLFLRERQGATLGSRVDAIADAVRSARPREFACAQDLGALLHDRYGWAVTEEELLYLALHVSRLTAPAAS